MYSKSRCHSAALTTISLLGFMLSIASAQAQVKTRLSIATGGTRGGTYRMAFDEDNLVGAGLVDRCRAGFGLSGSDRDLVGLALFAFAASLPYLHWRASTGRVPAPP